MFQPPFPGFKRLWYVALGRGEWLRLQFFALASRMLALACQFGDAFGIGTGLTAIFLPACRYTIAGGMGAFRCCSHGVLLFH